MDWRIKSLEHCEMVLVCPTNTVFSQHITVILVKMVEVQPRLFDILRQLKR